jgi:uncharacterized protein YecE (DUF72 family)
MTEGTPDVARLKQDLTRLAASGVYFGTSSWKYAGWLDRIYTRDRYIWRGRFAETRFERLCLAEYAETFPTVCVDAAYYTFPRESAITAMGDQVPDQFRFAFKVTGDITIKRFPMLDRFGPRAGQENPSFLNAGLFADRFLEPCRTLGERLGIALFEFSRFHSSEFARGREFIEQLDGFLEKLPEDCRYGVEIRNPNFLQPEYFTMLARHGVAHVFNSWEGMPSVIEQIDAAGDSVANRHGAARFLLRPGRDYKEAVQRFSPYARLQDPYPEGVAAGAQLAGAALRSPSRRPLFLYVNNRFEGNAPQSIRRMLDALERAASPDAVA